MTMPITVSETKQTNKQTGDIIARFKSHANSYGGDSVASGIGFFSAQSLGNLVQVTGVHLRRHLGVNLYMPTVMMYCFC